MQGGYALKFASRDKGRSDSISEGDKNVGKISVMFMAAQAKQYFRERRYDDRRRDDDFDDYNEPGQFAKEKMNQRVKETISFLRTVRGTRIEQPRRRGGGGGGSPATVVNDYVYASIVVHYDTPDHLRFRGILRPQSIMDHRQFFPDEDFRGQMRQRVRATKREKRVVGDLTNDDQDIKWSRIVDDAPMKAGPSAAEQAEEDRQAAEKRQRERLKIRRNREARRNSSAIDHEEPEGDGPVKGVFINLTTEPLQHRSVARKRARTNDDKRRVVHMNAVAVEEEEPWEGHEGEDEGWEAVDY